MMPCQQVSEKEALQQEIETLQMKCDNYEEENYLLRMALIAEQRKLAKILKLIGEA